MMWRRRLSYFLLLIPLIIYIITASRTLPWSDGTEFYVAIRNLGIPHPSGYPLFLLIGRIFYLFFRKPFILNLLPGIFTTIGLYFLFFIILKLTKKFLPGLALTLGFGLCQEIWKQSVTAEIYTLNLTFMLIALYLLLRLKEQRLGYLFLFTAGLALTNHLTAVFYIIPFAFFFRRELKPRWGILFFFFPLLLYLYFPIRTRFNPIPNLFHPAGLINLFEYVSGQTFHYRTLFFSGNYFLKELVNFLKLWWNQFFILIPLGFYGIIKLDNKRLRYTIVSVILLVFFYTISYNIPDKQGYYLPLFGLWLILIAVAISKFLPRLYHPVLFVFPLFNFFYNLPICNYSQDSSLIDLSRTIYKSLPGSSILISDDYYLYFAIHNLEIDKAKGIIPISQFYLRMDWYLNDLQKIYSLKIPASAWRLIKECNTNLQSVDKSLYGELSKRYCHLIQRELIKANIDHTPIFIFIYNDASWPREWLDFYLEYYGLYYRFQTEPPAQLIYPLDLPSPEYYQIGKFRHPDAIVVIKKFAAAYNRRGINRFTRGDFQGAVKDFKQALKYFPEYYQVYSNLGLVYLKLGDTTRALNYWGSYLQSGYQSKETRKIRAWYNQLIKKYPGANLNILH